MRLPHLLIPLAAASLLASCNNISHLLVYQHSNIGFCAGLNPETTNVHVRLGVRQEVATLVPKVEIPTGNNDETVKNAASAYVGMRVKMLSAFAVPEVEEIVASGKAAENVGAVGDPIKPFTATKGTGTSGE